MNASLKVVTQLPLQELWRDDGFKTVLRLRYLSAGDIRNLLLAGRIQFVVADVGVALRWISSGECFDFWKTEVQTHLAAPESQTVLDEFPDSYCYFASEWDSQNGTVPIVVLEKHH